MIIKLFDSLNKKYKITLENNINIYTCGVTPYRETHIGNLRVPIVINVIENIYACYGFKCNHISNITDIGYIEDSEEASKQIAEYVKK